MPQSQVVRPAGTLAQITAGTDTVIRGWSAAALRSAITSLGGGPGAPDTSVQYNNGGSLAGSANFVFNGVDTLTLNKNINLVDGTTVITKDAGNNLEFTDINAGTKDLSDLIVSGVAGALQYSDGTAFDSNAAALFWNSATSRLGIGTNAPGVTLDVRGGGKFASAGINDTVKLKPESGADRNRILSIDDNSSPSNFRQLNIGVAPTAGWLHATLSGYFLQAGKFNAVTSKDLYIMCSDTFVSDMPHITCQVNTHFVGIGGTTSPDRYLHVEFEDAVTAAITYAQRLSHTTSGAAAALFGTGTEVELEDDAGNSQVASENVTLWADASTGVESPLIRETTYPAGSAGPGYRGFWTWNDVDNTARTVIPNGAGDVTGILTVTYAVSESGGGTSGGTTTATPGGGAVNLYTDGVDTFTLTVAADGSVTVVRSAGAATADIVLNMVWI